MAHIDPATGNIASGGIDMTTGQPAMGGGGTMGGIDMGTGQHIHAGSSMAERQRMAASNMAVGQAMAGGGLPLQNKASKPPNAVDISADLVPAGRRFWSPMLSYFDSMGMPASMPTELLPFLTRGEYAAKMEEMNAVIRKLEDSFNKKKKCWCFLMVPPIIFIGMCILFPWLRSVQANLRNTLRDESKRIFADWTKKGLGVLLLPGEEAGTRMLATPNVIRVVLPPPDGQ